MGEGAPVNLAELAAMAWGQHAQPPDVQRTSRRCQSHLLKRRSARLILLLKTALASSGAVTALSLSPEPAARPVLSSRHVAGKAQSHGQHSESSRATSRSFLRPARRPHGATAAQLERASSETAREPSPCLTPCLPRSALSSSYPSRGLRHPAATERGTTLGTEETLHVVYTQRCANSASWFTLFQPKLQGRCKGAVTPA